MSRILTFVVSVVVVFLSQLVHASEQFPMHPDPLLTPGSTCTSPNTYRYPEHIPYCTRNVTTGTKKQIIVTYDEQRGFAVGLMERSLIKIDHYIPLCMGGSNKVNNLWPQYKDVYEQTDALEGRLCELLAGAKLTQATAIAMIRRAKNDFSEISEIWDEISRLE